MADDIQTLEEELNDLFTEVDRVLKSLQSLSGRDRDTVCLSFPTFLSRPTTLLLIHLPISFFLFITAT